MSQFLLKMCSGVERGEKEGKSRVADPGIRLIGSRSYPQEKIGSRTKRVRIQHKTNPNSTQNEPDLISIGSGSDKNRIRILHKNRIRILYKSDPDLI